jgi:formylglycine-generating enzyme
MSFWKNMWKSSRHIGTSDNPAMNLAKDDAGMILIPTGSFMMGGNGGLSDWLKHEVLLDSFYLDKYPVTNAKFKIFVDATSYVTTAERGGG